MDFCIFWNENWENRKGSAPMEVRRMRLDTVKPGQRCVLREIELPAAQRTRLEELGLLPGTQIRCLYAAPCGTPAAYAIGGAVFALRRKDAARIVTEELR